MVEDFVLRFAWAIAFGLVENNIISPDLITSILAPLEVFRRFVWNFFRLENEHLNNCGKFRAVRDISIAPIDSSDQTTILRMMDEPEGVINRFYLQFTAMIARINIVLIFFRYNKNNRPKPKKIKDPEKKQLINPHPFKTSLQDLTIDMSGTKKL